MSNQENMKNESKIKEENDSCFKIIALGGDAKSKVKEAMEKIKEGKFTEASELMKVAQENITNARIVQQQMLTKDVRNSNHSVSSVLLNHAMDILITAESELSMVDFIFELMKKSTND